MHMHDFEDTLKKWLIATNPKKILEYGPGHSTKLMLKHCPKAEIISIEHQVKWYKTAKKQFGKKIKLILELTNRYKCHYACWPLIHQKDIKYDLIFIDGRRRVECLTVALQVVSNNGVVIIHDADRIEYQHGISLFDIVEDNGRTKVLKKKQQVI